MPISILLYNAYGDILYISDKSKKIGKAKVKKSGIDKSSVSLYHCKIKTGRRRPSLFSVCVIVMLKLRGEISAKLHGYRQARKWLYKKNGVPHFCLFILRFPSVR